MSAEEHLLQVTGTTVKAETQAEDGAGATYEEGAEMGATPKADRGTAKGAAQRADLGAEGMDGRWRWRTNLQQNLKGPSRHVVTGG